MNCCCLVLFVNLFINQLAGLSREDMKVIHNMWLLAGSSNSKKSSSDSFSLKFSGGGQKVKTL